MKSRPPPLLQEEGDSDEMESDIPLEKQVSNYLLTGNRLIDDPQIENMRLHLERDKRNSKYA